MIRAWLAVMASIALAGAAGAQVSPAVGERYDGYLGYIGTPSEAVRRQVSAINIKRRSLYSDLAAKKGVSPEEIGMTAGCTTLSRVAVGGLYFMPEGGWQRRQQGQAAPAPAYCGQ